MIAVGRDLMFTRSDHGYAVLTHPLPGRRLRCNLPREGADPVVAHIQTDLFQLFSHAWSAIAAQAETRLFFNMCQRDQIRALSQAGRAVAECSQTTRTHGVWLAKNTVAFFKISLSSLRMRFSRRSRSFSWARLKSSFETTSVSGYVVIHLFSVDTPTPPSRDIAPQCHAVANSDARQSASNEGSTVARHKGNHRAEAAYDA